MKLLKLTLQSYRYFMDEMADPRSKSLWLMESPVPMIVILFIYLKFVTKWGRNFMENRKPFNVDKILIVYNLIQIVCSVYICAMAIRYTFFLGEYSFLCQPVDKSNNPEALRVVSCAHFYFLIKVFDLLDTVFFVLRKKWSQVSFLHIYHHAGMVMTAWGGAAFVPGGQSVFLGLVNSAVHVVMYTYYLVSLLSKNQKYIWWKKYITQIQLVQFLLLTLNNLALVLLPYCGYPKFIGVYIMSESISFLFMFGDFYYKTYIKKSSKT